MSHTRRERVSFGWMLRAVGVVGLGVLGVATRPAGAFYAYYPAVADVNFDLGAYTFYNRGFIGQNAIIANIEAGFISNTHETLSFRGSSFLYFSDPSLNATYPQWVDFHATAVGHAIGGYNQYPYQYGLAPFSTVWSGAIATSWENTGPDGFSTSFNISQKSFGGAYYQAAVSGVSNTYYYGNLLNFGTADVITSSWGGGGAPGGDSYEAVALDAIAHLGKKLICVSAGNEGPTANTVGSPANGFNTLTVGALTQSRANQGVGTFDAVADFSSRGPQDLSIPLGKDGNAVRVVKGARARVDITAPGDNLYLAAYIGKTGGNQYLDPSVNFPPGEYYFTGIGGTSFATPVVAGGAGLLVDESRVRYAANAASRDGRVLKAVLMNSADKIYGWTNNAAIVNGVSITSQGLDYDSGAGRLNLDAAYHQYSDGTNDVPGVVGGAVGNIGWDYAEVPAVGGAYIDYPITPLLKGDSTFTATLTWYAHELIDAVTYDASYGSFYNLDLQLWTLENGQAGSLVAESVSPYNSSEQISFVLPRYGNYMLRVVNEGAVWSFTTDATVPYGLAWSATVPEPGIGMAGATLAWALTRRRR